MTRPLSKRAKRSAFAQETSEVWIVLLTFSHPSWTDDARIASDPFELLPNEGVKGVVSNGLEYIFAPFSISLPTQDDTGVARAQIEVENVSRRLMQLIRQARAEGGTLSISMQIVLSSDVDTPELSVENYRLEKVNYDSLTVSGEIGMEYFDLEPFPYQKFGPSNFPAIF